MRWLGIILIFMLFLGGCSGAHIVEDTVFEETLESVVDIEEPLVLWETRVLDTVYGFFEDSMRSAIHTEYGLLLRSPMEIFMLDMDTGQYIWSLDGDSVGQAWYIEGDTLIYPIYKDDWVLQRVDMETGQIVWTNPIARNSPPMIVHDLFLVGDYLVAIGNFDIPKGDQPLTGYHTVSGVSVHEFETGRIVYSFSSGGNVLSEEFWYTNHNMTVPLPYVVGMRDFYTGEIVWESVLDDRDGSLSPPSRRDIYLTDSTVIYYLSSDVDSGRTIGLDRYTGDLLWQLDDTKVLAVKDNRVLLAGTKEVLVYEHGVELERYLVGATFGAWFDENLFLLGDSVLVISEGEVIWRVVGSFSVLEQTEAVLENYGWLYLYRDKEVLAVDASGKEVSFAADRVYFAGDLAFAIIKGRIRGFDLKTGEEIWVYEYPDNRAFSNLRLWNYDDELLVFRGSAGYLVLDWHGTVKMSLEDNVSAVLPVGGKVLIVESEILTLVD